MGNEQSQRSLSKTCNKIHGRYWIRTSDPFRVKEVRYHCANRPHNVILNHQLQLSFRLRVERDGRDRASTAATAQIPFAPEVLD